MFLAAIMGPAARVTRARKALAFHGAQLGATGWTGPLVDEAFTGGLLAWDSAASHMDVLRDPERGSTLLRGGYITGDDGWDADGRHTTERDDAWGEFAAVTVRTSPADRTALSAFADPAASWPIYVGRRDESLVVSNDPHFVALALGFTDLSEQGVYELLAYHHSLGPETTVSGVERLFPGDRLHVLASESGVDQFEIASKVVYRYTSKGASDAVIEREALDALRRSVTQIRPLSGGAFADATVQISGGLDSRLTAAVLSEAFPERPDVVTLDLSRAMEMDIAREVATRLGYPHRSATLADTDVETMRVGWLLTGGQVSPYAAAGNILSYETAHRSAEGRVLLVGAWPGDCLIGSYVPLEPGMSSRILKGFLAREWAAKRGYSRIGPGGGVSGPRAEQVARAAKRRLRKRLIDGSGSTAAQLISYWAMFGRQPAFSYVAPAMLTSHVLPVTPVLARPYLEQLLRFRGRQIIGKNLYRSMIAHGFPALADVPNASTGEPVTDVRVVVPWLPQSVGDLYMRLPVVVQSVIHATLGRKRRQTAATSTTAESDHWSEVLGGEASDRVEAEGIVVTSGPGSDLHVRTVTRGLRWTVDYLAEGAEALGTW